MSAHLSIYISSCRQSSYLIPTVDQLWKSSLWTVHWKLWLNFFIMSSAFYQAITARDSMAKSLYSALFDWIVLRINHALLNKKDMEESIPVRDAVQ